MNKISTLIFALLIAANGLYAQCVIDPNAQTSPGVNPPANQLPCIVRGEPYNQTLQGKIQESGDVSLLIISLHVEVDSMRIDSIDGLPDGITWDRTPEVLLGGGNGCLTLSGITTDPANYYDLTAFGTAWLRVTSPLNYPYTYNGNLNNFSPFGNYYVRVIEPGGACVIASGVNSFNPELNTSLSVFPNPSQGVINIRMNSGKPLNGEVLVIDMIGRPVYKEAVDISGLYEKTIDLSAFDSGLYAVQLRTNEGIASKSVFVE